MYLTDAVRYHTKTFNANQIQYKLIVIFSHLTDQTTGLENVLIDIILLSGFFSERMFQTDITDYRLELEFVWSLDWQSFLFILQQSLWTDNMINVWSDFLPIFGITAFSLDWIFSFSFYLFLEYSLKRVWPTLLTDFWPDAFIAVIMFKYAIQGYVYFCRLMLLLLL